MHQTFDAVDGKQARRTSSSSPLGELFDHGAFLVQSFLQVLYFVKAYFLNPIKLLFLQGVMHLPVRYAYPYHP